MKTITKENSLRLWLISAHALLDNFVKKSVTTNLTWQPSKVTQMVGTLQTPVTGDDYKWHMRTNREEIVFFFFFLGVGGGTIYYSVIGYFLIFTAACRYQTCQIVSKINLKTGILY